MNATWIASLSIILGALAAVSGVEAYRQLRAENEPTFAFWLVITGACVVGSMLFLAFVLMS